MGRDGTGTVEVEVEEPPSSAKMSRGAPSRGKSVSVDALAQGSANSHRPFRSSPATTFRLTVGARPRLSYPTLPWALDGGLKRPSTRSESTRSNCKGKDFRRSSPDSHPFEVASQCHINYSHHPKIRHINTVLNNNESPKKCLKMSNKFKRCLKMPN